MNGPGLFFAVIVSVGLSAPVLMSKTVDLNWPGTATIPGVLALRGQLENDLYATAFMESPKLFSALLIDLLMPQDHGYALAVFDSLAAQFLALVTFLSILFAARFMWFLLGADGAGGGARFSDLLIATSFGFAIITASYRVDQLSFLKPMDIAGWRFPLHSSLDASGLAFALVLIAGVAFFRVWEIYGPEKLGTVRQALDESVVFILLLVSSLLHPVVPLFFPTVLVALMFLTQKARNRRFVVWVLGSVGIILATQLVHARFLFPQQPIDTADLFSIYVVSRHPHHYLPSTYLDGQMDSILAGALVLLVVLAIARKKVARKVAGLGLISVATSVIIHSAQFLLVEQFRLEVFILLGPSRLATIVSLLQVCILSIGIWVAGTRIKSRNLSALLSKASPIIFATTSLVAISGAIASLFLPFAWLDDKVAGLRNRPEIVATELPGQLIGNELRVLAEGPIATNSRWREIAGVAVYVDHYFPFSNGGMLEWNAREQAARCFLDSIKVNSGGERELSLAPHKGEGKWILLVVDSKLGIDSPFPKTFESDELSAFSVPMDQFLETAESYCGPDATVRGY